MPGLSSTCAPCFVIRIFSAQISTFIYPLMALCAFSVSDLRTGVEAHSTIDLRPQHHAPLSLNFQSLHVKLQISLLRPILGLKLVATLMKARKSWGFIGLLCCRKVQLLLLQCGGSCVPASTRPQLRAAAASVRSSPESRRRQEPFLPNACPALPPV